MRVNGNPRTSVTEIGSSAIEVIDQTALPYAFQLATLSTWQQTAEAITRMVVRGAPLIGIVGSYGLAMALRENATDDHLAATASALIAARPTAVNLAWAVKRVTNHVRPLPAAARADAAWVEARHIAEEDIAINHSIGEHGMELIRHVYHRMRRTVNVLTHCNAGWIATMDWGTALAPIYLAHDRGIPVHVWVDETRPRNQGLLTAWELAAHGVPHTLITDNAGGHLMQHAHVDLVMVGADRVTRNGDVCNKIGTYLKALAAHDNGVPFYAAVPSPTIDWNVRDALSGIPIEERSAEEVRVVAGMDERGERGSVRLADSSTPAANPAFDVTPARLVTGIITERGVVRADAQSLAALFDKAA